MKKVLLFVFFLFFLFTPSVFAQDSGWVINDFQSSIVVERNGLVSIHEAITVDFHSLQKHGIYRDIPYVYSTDGEKYYTEISVKNVLLDSSSVPYEVSTNGEYLRIKIGDPNTTISGNHTYIIGYTVEGVLQGFSSYDELYWNVTGNNWPVPIEHVATIVTLPQAGVVQVACYQGYGGTTESCTALAAESDERSAVFATTRSLDPFQGMTIAFGYKKGMVPLPVVERPKTFLEKFFSWPSALTLLSVVLFGFITSFFLWFKYGRDFWHGGTYHIDGKSSNTVLPMGWKDTIVAEFTPPQQLRPAEIGVLMDETADTLDVTSTIIDLTSKGYMTITEIPKKWVFGSSDYELKKTKKASSDLLSYETYILDSIFSSGDTKKVSSMKNDFYDELAKVKDMIYKNMVEKQFFVENPSSRRNLYGGIGIVLLIVGVWASFISAGSEYVYVADVTIGVAVSGIILLVFSRYMGRRSAKGREVYRRVRGYREFIYTAERYKQKFLEKENLFTEVLPYAMVFGLTEKFAQAMKEIGLKNPHMNGYYGTQSFNAYTFTNSVNTFSNSFSSAAASRPSSSGSGGGGSSGGGFGGGGGGSW